MKRKKQRKTKLANAVETLISPVPEVMVAETMGGRMQVQWDEGGAATPHGQLVFFAEFLAVSKLFEAWVDSCPLHYTSGNAPGKRDVLGTFMLGILAGSCRYAHLTGIRGDTVAAQALGMAKIVSADAVRRALTRMDKEASEAWLRPSLMRSVRPALDCSWILDIDASIKPLYGKQEGAEISYNPHKPGRPSHVLHTYWVGNLRQILDVQLSPGKQHTSAHAREGLAKLLDELEPKERPALVRGDCGFGNEPIISECEQRGQSYLFRLRQTSNVKKLLTRLFNRDDWSRATSMSQGWEAIEDSVKLAGWTEGRRVVVLRRRVKQDMALTKKSDTGFEQLLLPFLFDEVLEDDPKLWEYTVLVTNVTYDLQAIGQLYRDRCDCENGFDELKNQWGWGGFTTQDLTRNQTSARIIALIYNWWSWYVRAADPKVRREALTSRPLLLAAVGRAVKHSGQTLLHLTTMHGKPSLIKSLIANVQDALSHVKQVARQFQKTDPWAALLHYICRKISDASAPPKIPLLAPG